MCPLLVNCLVVEELHHTYCHTLSSGYSCLSHLANVSFLYFFYIFLLIQIFRLILFYHYFLSLFFMILFYHYYQPKNTWKCRKNLFELSFFIKVLRAYPIAPNRTQKSFLELFAFYFTCRGSDNLAIYFVLFLCVQV